MTSMSVRRVLTSAVVGTLVVGGAVLGNAGAANAVNSKFYPTMSACLHDQRLFQKEGYNVHQPCFKNAYGKYAFWYSPLR